MKKIKKLSLVKYRWKSLPKEWRKGKENPYKDITFIYIGEIPNMPGHIYCVEIKTGLPRVFHTESIKELTEEET